MFSANSDLLSCHVIGADGVRNHRFLVVESNQIILVVPVPGQLGQYATLFFLKLFYSIKLLLFEFFKGDM